MKNSGGPITKIIVTNLTDIMKVEPFPHNTNQPEVVARLGVSLSYLTKFNLLIATAVASFTNSFKNLFKIYFILILLTFMESTHLRTIINPN